MHELKYSLRKSHDLSFLKSNDLVNKIVWSITGEDIDGIIDKSILDTFDKALLISKISREDLSLKKMSMFPLKINKKIWLR